MHKHIHLKDFVCEDQSTNRCYIHYISPEMHLECYVAIKHGKV